MFDLAFYSRYGAELYYNEPFADSVQMLNRDITYIERENL